MNALAQFTIPDLTRVLAKLRQPVVGDLVEFVKSHPSNPYPNIRWGLALMYGIKDTDDLAFTKKRLEVRLEREKAKIDIKHWSADPQRVATAKLLLSLIDEFQATTP
jgi:hypothetical protein